MDKTLNTKIIIRNDTTQNWEAVADTVVLAKGEMGIELGTEGAKIKVGDGVNTWKLLKYASGEKEIKIINKKPTENTPGEEGRLYYDTSTSTLYLSSGTMNGVYQWASIAAQHSTVRAALGLERSQDGWSEQIGIDDNNTGADGEVGKNALWTAFKIKTVIDSTVALTEAMVFKGVVTLAEPLPNAGMRTGDTYKVGENGTYAQRVCEVGDMIICVDPTSGSDLEVWAILQNNLDGAVTSSATSATDGNIAVYDGTTGKIIKEGTKKISDLEYVLPEADSNTLGGVRISQMSTVIKTDTGELAVSNTVVTTNDTLILNGGSAAN